MNESVSLIDNFIDTLWLERGSSEHTLEAYRRDLLLWSRFLGEPSKLLTPPESALDTLLVQRKHQGYSPRSDARLLSSLRRFYRWALLEQLIEADPISHVQAIPLKALLPKTLDEQDVDRLLEAPDTDTALGLRDRAMLEILYACGLRVTELVSLRLDSLNLRQGVVRVLGKGNKERLVPLGEEAVDWLERYIREGRGELMSDITRPPLFPGRHDDFMTRQTFWYRIKSHAKTAGIEKPLSPHTLRHAFATHLLDHGANLRVVQELLGHQDLSTTQIYTHVAQRRLEELHHTHHPRG
ncbi:Tyrosine recombinase XerD [Halomonadaceae bacterium LMG 33818]